MLERYTGRGSRSHWGRVDRAQEIMYLARDMHLSARTQADDMLLGIESWGRKLRYLLKITPRNFS